MKLNFASIDIKRSPVDADIIEIYSKVHGLQDDILFTKNFSVTTANKRARNKNYENKQLDGFHSLDYNSTLTRYSRMCRLLHNEHRLILELNKLLESLVVDKDVPFIVLSTFMFYIIPMALPIAIAIRLLTFFVFLGGFLY